MPPSQRRFLRYTRIMTERPNQKINWLLVGSIVVIALIVALIVFFWQPMVELFTDKDRLKTLVEQAGFWGPLVFIGVQFLQVIIAPIPGQAVGALAGALFGPWLGTLYSMIGALLGFTLIFVVSRQLGRPFVERFVDKEHLAKFDYLTKTNGPMVFFLIFLLPAFPDDIICYLAGLSAIPIRTLVVVSLAGRLPGYLVLAFLGAGIAEADGRLIGSIVAFIALVGALAYWQRKPLEAWVRRIGGARDGTSRDE